MSDIRTVKVIDSVIGDITDNLDFAVYSGASQNTFQRFPSTSSSNSSLVFNCQIPSENVIIDRAVMIQTPLSLVLTVTNTAANLIPQGMPAIDYGRTSALQAFPLNSLFTTCTVQVNNTTLNVNLQDIMAPLLKMSEPRVLSEYCSMCPAMPDQLFGNFSDATQTSMNVMSGLANTGLDTKTLARGCHPVKITVISHTSPAVAAAGTVAAIAAVNDTNITSLGRAGESWQIRLDTIVTEPVFVSPFTWGNAEYNNQGLTGINNMQFIFNLDSQCKRVFSTMSKNIVSIGLYSSGSQNAFNASGAVGITNAPAPSLLFRFLSSQPSDLIKTKNVCPIIDYPRYLTASSNTTALASKASATLTSSNLQINQVPDKIIIVVRKPISQQKWTDASAFLAINSISINFNNSSGLLSSASSNDLWRMSIRNGSVQSWAEFSGQQGTESNNSYSLVPTLGSMLVLSPPLDMSLPNYISSGSLGNYNMQFSVNVTNQFNEEINPEICVIMVNSGILVSQQGVSAVYSGLLTKNMVLDTMNEQAAGAMTTMEIARKIGGNMQNAALSSVGGMMKYSKAGAFSGGGASSGGASSGGRLSKHY